MFDSIASTLNSCRLSPISSLILLVLLLSYRSASSQQSITNELSDQHVYVKETRVSIIPPKDAQLSNAFLGFSLDKKGSNITIGSSRLSYSDFMKSDYDAELKAAGVELLSTEQYFINNLPARLTLSKANVNGLAAFIYQLIMGDAKETVVLAGQYSQDSPELGDNLKKALLSVVYDTSKEVDHKKVLPFKISTAGTSFKLASTIPTGKVYSTDGKYPSASRLIPIIFITESSLPDVSVDKKKFFIDYQERLNLKIRETVFLRKVTIDGLEGYEAYYKGNSKDNAMPENNYIVFLYTSSNTFYKVQGFTMDHTTKTLEEFKKIAKSFERY